MKMLLLCFVLAQTWMTDLKAMMSDPTCCQIGKHDQRPSDEDLEYSGVDLDIICSESDDTVSTFGMDEDVLVSDDQFHYDSFSFQMRGEFFAGLRGSFDDASEVPRDPSHDDWIECIWIRVFQKKFGKFWYATLADVVSTCVLEGLNATYTVVVDEQELTRYDQNFAGTDTREILKVFLARIFSMYTSKVKGLGPEANPDIVIVQTCYAFVLLDRYLDIFCRNKERRTVPLLKLILTCFVLADKLHRDDVMALSKWIRVVRGFDISEIQSSEVEVLSAIEYKTFVPQGEFLESLTLLAREFIEMLPGIKPENYLPSFGSDHKVYLLRRMNAQIRCVVNALDKSWAHQLLR